MDPTPEPAAIKPAPLHEVFLTLNSVLRSDTANFQTRVRVKQEFAKHFAEQAERVKRGRKNTDRFLEVLSWIVNAEPHPDFDHLQYKIFADLELRQDLLDSLYLLASGFSNSRQDLKRGTMTMLFNYRDQIISLAKGKQKEPRFFTLADLAKETMNGNFIPNFFEKATSLASPQSRG